MKPQRCAANCRDGSRCGKYCAPGDVVCAKHKPSAPLTGIIAAQDTDDLGELLRRLTKDRDSAIRLRAIEALLKYQERRTGCASCKANAQRETSSERFIAYATDAQCDQLRALIAGITTIKAGILEYIGAGGTPHQEASYGTKRQHDQSTGTRAAASVAPAVEHPAAPPSEVDDVLYEGERA